MIELKQSTAVTLKIGPFVDETDGVTPETALTIAQADVRLSKNGGNMAQKGNATSCTHDEIGYYDCPVSTTDTGTLGILQLMVNESGALPVWNDYMVVTGDYWDMKYANGLTDIADATLERGVSNVEDAADTRSLAAVILGQFESSMSGTTWTIRKTGGATFATPTLTIDAAADPITGVT